jgi:hypothetical protein
MTRRSRLLGQRLTFLALALLVGAQYAFTQAPWQSICRFAGLAILIWALILLVMDRWGKGRPPVLNPPDTYRS